MYSFIITLTSCSDEGKIQVFTDAKNIVYQLSPSPSSLALDCLCSSLDVSVIQMAGSISVSWPSSSSLQTTQHSLLGSSSLITSFVKMSRWDTIYAIENEGSLPWHRYAFNVTPVCIHYLSRFILVCSLQWMVTNKVSIKKSGGLWERL